MNGWRVPGYTESRELGSGTSGRVVLAVHDATGVPVAVKYLADRLRRDPAFVRGFRDEARLLGGLGSSHVVGLYEYVEAPDGAAIVMELVDGIALRALLRQEGSTGPEAALSVLKGSLLGLAAAHRAGVVHRDYKPENVLVSADGSSKLADFGIATGHGSTAEVAGTPPYMAPEQWQGEPASPAADVYAATVTFYECLTGHKPYAAENIAELAFQHMSAPVPDDQAPEPVRPLLRSGLAKRPEERPSDAAEFIAKLEEIAAAAYGADWEERGQRRLAALAALLPLLFPSAGDESSSTTDLATTALRGGAGAGVVAAGARGRRLRTRRTGGAGGTGLAAHPEHTGPTGPARAERRGRPRRTGRTDRADHADQASAIPPSKLRAVLSAAGPLGLAAILAAGLFGMMVAAEGTDDGSTRTSARSLATTSARPDALVIAEPSSDGPARSPGPTRSGSATAGASAATAGPTSSSRAGGGSGERNGAAGTDPASGARSGASSPATASPSSTKPAGTPTTTRPTTAPTATPTTPVPTVTAPVRVESVSVSGLTQTDGTTDRAPTGEPSGGPGPSAEATIRVATGGTGPLTVVVTWYLSEVPGELGAADGSETFQLSGARQYVLTPGHTYQQSGCYLGARATTSPGAANGGSSEQILNRRCAAESSQGVTPENR
ncbi:serine/threonine-protein kinase [Streptomyces jumonjinensis]|uniref:serine/threonine-protein kinase n=1 Tax=Streptomyces jumonjinensis TaxID=1945 RepID=UPI0033226AD0